MSYVASSPCSSGTTPTADTTYILRHYLAWSIIAGCMIMLGWLAITAGMAADDRDRLASQEAFSAYRSAASEAAR